jgi:DNA-binding transcriptional LysR family regulator
MRTGLELRHLRVFAAVVDAGGHTRAARALGLSQSTVSETLAALERTLGVELFRKAAKGQTLTASGEVLLAYARRMSDLTSELTAALADASTNVQATLVVSAVESIGAYVLPSRLALLRERWPGVRAEVLTGSCAEIRRRVAAGESDLGLVLEPESGPATGEVLARVRLLVVAAPTSSLLGRTVAVEELRARVFHMCDAGGPYHQALRQWFETSGSPAPRVEAMGTIEGVKRAVLAGGAAVGLLPEHAIEAELRDGVLVEVRIAPALPGVALRAVVALGAPRSPVIEALVASLRGSPRQELRLMVSAVDDEEPQRTRRRALATPGA